MGLLDSYQDSTDTALTVMASRPIEPEAAKPKHSAWSTPFRAVAAGAAEVAGNVVDTAGAFGQVVAATGGIGPGIDPDARKNRQESIEAMDTLKRDGINWRTDEAKQAYQFGADLRPDPLTAGTAENLVFSLTKGLTKAIGAATTLGPVGGAAVFGASEGMTTAEDLANQGVDKTTRTKVGIVSAGVNALGLALPVSGKTLTQTTGLVVAGGPGSFITQQLATREILRNANYKELADQYDPLDPVGLAVSTLLPAGFAAYAKRGGFAIRKDPIADGKPVADSPPDTQETSIAATPEAIDAAMVQNLTVARDVHAAIDAEIQSQSIPEVKDGYVRLYRGQTKGEFPPAVDWIQGSGPSEKGRWFSTDKAAADFYGIGGVIKYVDVPKSVADESIAEGMYSSSGRLLPAEWANKANEFKEPSIAQTDSTTRAIDPPDMGNPISQESTTDAYRARVDALAKEQPDLIARLDDSGRPVKLTDELAAIKKQAQEGTDTEFGAMDAPLLKIAAECALSIGTAGI